MPDACNRAARAARGRKLLFLDDGTLVPDNWLQPILDEADSDPGIGATVPALTDAAGRLAAAGALLRHDGRIEYVGAGEWPESPRYAYGRDVDLCPHACLAIDRDLFATLGGLDAAYATLPFAVADLCLKVERAGYRLRYCAASRVAWMDAGEARASGLVAARDRLRLLREWQETLDERDRVRAIAFYLPQFHAIPENDAWWGEGFTEWTNVRKAEPNFPGHDQPRRPAELGYYDLDASDVLARQVELARRYGIGGFCYYYYWFHGRRLLERPIERMLRDKDYDFPFCLCWANENWTRRWDGKEHEVLIGQEHSDQDDREVIADIARFFAHGAYIRIRGRPLILVYRTDLFPDFARTADIWRETCRRAGMGEIFIARVETSFGQTQPAPGQHGCDASVEFPPHALGDLPPLETGNRDPAFKSFVVDYRAAALQYAGKAPPAYPRFPGVMPGWDNTARRQKDGACFHRSTPGAFQAWFEAGVRVSKQQFTGDERLVFVNAWNEWAEGAYLEPDQRHGHAYLQAAASALDADRLLRKTQ
ncbi:MAG TPA: glycoside hydrolase family 99-like domain-containing protein [Luteimonas sp.]|nr:glycoside hydrolase family 99-like domain-containing protein [Luteimonas sp.]